ncbi:prepilin peptidase [Bifidobacterium saimiriisciurei]|nr:MULTISPECIES: prepilin peptidase [Bifidobacterium]
MIAYTDIRTRRVPRMTVASGCVLQVACVVVWCLHSRSWTMLAWSVGLAATCALVQLGLAMIRPGTLGFGDVTCTLLMGLAVGCRGVETVAVWWLFMGLFGLIMLRIQRGRGRDSIPFAPVIVASAFAAVALSAI